MYRRHSYLYMTHAEKRARRHMWDTIEQLSAGLAGAACLLAVLGFGFIAAYVGGIAGGGHASAQDKAFFIGDLYMLLACAVVMFPALAVAFFARIRGSRY